jgi:2',3'-cyclic-nucleotide 2'-phosphodiesterase/3'-nucleotidase/5'-nucleotidase
MTKKYAWLFLFLALGAALIAACKNNDDEGGGDGTTVVVAPDARIVLGFLGRYNTGLFDAGGAEIPAFDPLTDRLFVVNAGPSTVDVLNIADPENPVLITSIDCTLYGNAGSPNSVAVHNGILAIAIQDGTKTNPGVVVFFNTNETVFDLATDLNVLTVGALPDMVTFTPDGNFALVANEGEPNDDYTIDPEGSVSVINLTGGVATATVATAGFASFNPQKATLINQGVRIFGPESTIDEPDDIATVAQDLEPEYITCNDTTAWVTIQEANAIARVDIATATVTQIRALGFKDHSLISNALDPTNNDNAITFKTGRVFGMYQPDAIASYTVNGDTYLVTANEGDTREWTGTPGFVEFARISNAAFTLDAAAYPNAATFKTNNEFGRLNATLTLGDTDNDADFDNLYCFGARSFTIWNSNAQRVWDSGDALEQITAAALPLNFNCNNDDNALDARSDDKGPEPEAATVAQIDGRWYAFIGLERVGGIVVYDVTKPTAPRFQTYFSSRDYSQTPADPGQTGVPVPGLDLGPEGIIFVPAVDSPNGRDLLIVAHEISGSTAIYEVSKLFD